MAINFLPISFQDSSTACDGLGAGFCGSAFLASWANTGIAASATATSRVPQSRKLFIVSLLIVGCFWICFRACSGLLSVNRGRHTLSDGPRGQVFLWLGRKKPDLSAGFILRRRAPGVMENRTGQAW